MKDTLEYKILKYLKENDNGDFIDMIGFIDDRELLDVKLRSLSKYPDKYISVRLPFFIVGGGLPDFIDDKLKAKIEFKGIKFLDEIENKNITNSGIYINKNENKGNQSFENIANKKQVNAEPNNNPEQKSRFKKILSSSWFIGISLVFLAAILNAERIKNWIDSVMNGL